MYGMRERIDSNDIKLLDDFFKAYEVDSAEFEKLKSKIDLLVKQDEISTDAGQKITELQNQIYKLYEKDGDNVEKVEEK